MTKPTDFRALCKELVDALLCWQSDGAWIDQAEWLFAKQSRLIARARTALAQTETPTLKEQALDELTSAERLYPADWTTIRRALEQLND